VDAIATDHAPHPGSEKMQEFEKCPFGIIGLETAVAVTLEKLVHSGRIPLVRWVELFTTGPARVLGLNRGRLEPGLPGDVTVFRSRAGLDLRREPLVLEEPQLAVSRPQFQGRAGGDGGGRQKWCGSAADGLYRCASIIWAISFLPAPPTIFPTTTPS